MAEKGPKGRVHTVSERCKGCGFCIEFCPMKVLQPSRELNRGGFHYPVAAFPEKCSGCEMCGMVCPDFAIWAEKLSREKGKEEE